MTPALDHLLSVLRTTLKEPPQIVMQAERELASLRAENEDLRTSGEHPVTTLEGLALSTSKVLASEYTYRAKEEAAEITMYLGLCDEFQYRSYLSYTEIGALNGIRKVVADSVYDMLLRGETLPKPRGDR